LKNKFWASKVSKLCEIWPKHAESDLNNYRRTKRQISQLWNDGRAPSWNVVT